MAEVMEVLRLELPIRGIEEIRGVVIFAALLGARQAADAGDRGTDSFHFSPHPGAKFHPPGQRLKFEPRDSPGQHPPQFV
jgi:hypothetical protein